MAPVGGVVVKQLVPPAIKSTAVAAVAGLCIYRTIRFAGKEGKPVATQKFLDPRAAVDAKDRPLVPGLETLEGKVIGIIDNGQSNSTDMFKELGRLIESKYHVKEVLF